MEPLIEIFTNFFYFLSFKCRLELSKTSCKNILTYYNLQRNSIAKVIVKVSKIHF